MPTDHHLREALRLFDAALEQPEAERAVWLRRQCGGDAALRADVEAMLAADARDATDDVRLELSARTLEPRPVDEATDALVGSRIGHWRITGVLGRGGMGAVYAVERDDGQFTQQAALKRVRIGLDNPLARDRFLRERQILARLRHPGIAQLLDGGVDAGGAPYFVMERVDGERIDHWCDARDLDLRERVRLFLQVLDAVAYAHRNLVVHRDLKPGNLLIDASGNARLMDFGIAPERRRGRPDPHRRAHAHARVRRTGAIAGRRRRHRHRHLPARRAAVLPADRHAPARNHRADAAAATAAAAGTAHHPRLDACRQAVR